MSGKFVYNHPMDVSECIGSQESATIRSISLQEFNILGWTGICSGVRTRLVVIQEGSINAHLWITDILKPNVVSFAPFLGDTFRLMQDNVPPHIAAVVVRLASDNEMASKESRSRSDWALSRWAETWKLFGDIVYKKTRRRARGRSFTDLGKIPRSSSRTLFGACLYRLGEVRAA